MSPLATCRNAIPVPILLVAALLVLTFASRASADEHLFEPGTVTVNGYGWTIDPIPVELGVGERTYTSEEVLVDVEDQLPDGLTLETIPGIEVALPHPATNSIRCSRGQIIDGAPACPTFTFFEDYTLMEWQDGSKSRRYMTLAPEIYIPRAKEITVKLTPASKRIESGDSVDFTAKVNGETGPVTYSWNFGDGKVKTTTKGNVSHRFVGDDEQFIVVVNVSSPGQRSDSAVAAITVGKVEKPKPKKNKKEPEEEQNEDTGGYPSYSDPYDYGYGGYGGYGDYGGGTGTGTPSTPAPSGQQKPRQEEEPAPPVDDGLETVSGQLIDPGTTATVIPPTDSTTEGSTQEVAPADDSSGGGGISKGAMTAIGIGALLGLGGLAEAGAFAGGMRRFRMRP